jgi:predicted HD phosphohydrolase
MNEASLSEWAEEQAALFLSSLEQRWKHVQAVVERARSVQHILGEHDRSYLVAAAYLHDIGYAPGLRKTGFHPLDGAIYLRSQGLERLASLVAYHSGAVFEARLRGLDGDLQVFLPEHSSLAHALDYCDMTTGPLGQQMSFEERVTDIFDRYGENGLVPEAIRQAMPSLQLAVRLTQTALDNQE